MFKHLEKLTTVKLKKLCKDDKIPGYSGLKKTELMRHIKMHKLNIAVNEGLEKLVDM